MTNEQEDLKRSAEQARADWLAYKEIAQPYLDRLAELEAAMKHAERVYAQYVARKRLVEPQRQAGENRARLRQGHLSLRELVFSGAGDIGQCAWFTAGGKQLEPLKGAAVLFPFPAAPPAYNPENYAGYSQAHQRWWAQIEAWAEGVAGRPAADLDLDARGRFIQITASDCALLLRLIDQGGRLEEHLWVTYSESRLTRLLEITKIFTMLEGDD